MTLGICGAFFLDLLTEVRGKGRANLHTLVKAVYIELAAALIYINADRIVTCLPPFISAARPPRRI
jgi:hypothetical protein